LSPDVDVSIGNDNEDSVTEGIVQDGNVDDSLQQIKNDENGTQNGDDSMFDTSQDSKVVLPNSKKAKSTDAQTNAAGQMLNPDGTPVNPTAQNKQISKTAAPTASTAKPVAKTSTSSRRSRVVVGNYATAEQAEVAKGILQEAGLGVNPVIKNIGGAYTIQTGSFSSHESAQGAASNLLRNNFPARVISE
jgi:cell division protein FtsN